MSIDLYKLKERCLAPIKAFEELGEVGESKDGRHIYIDRGSPVLAIAHLDTVQSLTHFQTIRMGKRVHLFNAQLDDRLGAYIIVDYLPTLGIETDVLLTEGEESGRS